MKTLIIVIISTFFTINGFAESQNSEEGLSISDMNAPVLTYTLNFDENSYARFVSQVTEEGISPAKFGSFVSDNGIGSVSIDAGPVDGLWEERAELVIMKINVNGRILAEQTVTVQVSERGAPLRSNQIVSVVDRLFAGSNLHLSGKFDTNDIGGMAFSIKQIDRATQQFIREVPNNIRSLQVPHIRPELLEKDPVALGMMVMPAQNSELHRREDVEIQSSGVVFMLIEE